MNVRKPVDYGAMYRELAAILAQNLPQMDEIYAIGKTISQRPEKGAAVAAAEFLQANFPDRTGFSPRNVRRMRDFYKVYENDQTLLRLAMKIGWTLNVVIMEADTCYTDDKDIKTCVKRTSTHNIFWEVHCWVGQLWMPNMRKYISTRLLRRVSPKMFYIIRC